MRHLKAIAVLLLTGSLLAPLSCRANPDTDALRVQSLPELELRLAAIDAELEQLASYTLRGDTGGLGYRSKRYLQPDQEEWIRVNLGDTYSIDQIVLAPSLWRDSETGVRAEGFPLAFRIFAGTKDTSQLVASFSEEDNLLPRIVPLAVDLNPVSASWIRIETSTLSPDIGGGKYTLQLSEILVFSGKENVALQKSVSVPIPGKIAGPVHENNLTDGFYPYLMDSAQGIRSQTELMQVRHPEPPPSLTIDLKTSHPITQVNLHTAGVALSIPMINFSSWAVPRHVRVTGANQPDFSDETTLFEHKQESVYDTGPIIMHSFPEILCRYVRIYILDHNSVASLTDNPFKIGFSEIEVLSRDQKNLALGAPITASSGLSASHDALAKVTDGLNYYGKILSIKDWMGQLAHRHDLEFERPLVLAELSRRYERQKLNLHLLAWAFALLTAGTIISILVGKVLQQRAVFKTRERIAADLHDELGANLHAIGLFGDLAKQEVSQSDEGDKWNKLIRYVDEVRSLTELAGKTARYTTNMLEAKELYEDLPQEMRRTAGRLLTDLQHQASFTNESALQTLSPRKRLGLFLFYKECLTNVIRHSRATHVESRLSAKDNEICLSVSDNGRGLSNTRGYPIPASLKRRARLLKAKLSVESPSEGGTRITLKLKPRRNWILPKRKTNGN